jgi:hypothetical protein
VKVFNKNGDYLGEYRVTTSKETKFIARSIDSSFQPKEVDISISDIKAGSNIVAYANQPIGDKTEFTATKIVEPLSI